MTSATELKSLFTVQLSAIGSDGEGGRHEWEADADQRAALAARFGCVEIPRLQIESTITPLRKDGYFRVRGVVSTRVVQTCVISLAPVATDIEKRLELILCPEFTGDASNHEFDDEQDQDYETYKGNTVDLGEICAIELALALDPYPRAPGVSVADLGPGGGDNGFEVSEEDQVGRYKPFETLATLKRKG
jgi:hypothetical protein